MIILKQTWYKEIKQVFKSEYSEIRVINAVGKEWVTPLLPRMIFS